MQYQLAIFDMDGTILNTLQDLTNSLNAALAKSGYPQHTAEEVRFFVGNGIRKLIERGVPAGTPVEQIDTVHHDFTAHYQVHCADTTQPYDGIPELLQTLRRAGCKTAVVSNKADYAVQELCKQYFDGMFDFAVGEREKILKKPAPDSVNEVLQKLQIDRKQAVYIGDSDVDVQTAKNAAMDGIFVEWGFRSKEFLLEHGAVLTVSAPNEIAHIILEK
ncbi:MAG: HAD family hydrolase [Oscillospiraceae bacterium]|nr:HAD family hydrolase [Oscillospiraceae bacterium]MDY2509933.1 HAD family hydrolase [Ruminococcus callidus]